MGSACWSRVRPAISVVAVLVGEPGAGRRDAVELRIDQPERPARDEHRGGVHHVLARGAVMDEAGGLAVELLS